MVFLYPLLDELLFEVAKKYKIESDFIVNNHTKSHGFERNLLMYLFALNPRYSMVEKGRFLGVSGSAISKASQRFVDKMKTDEHMRKEVELIRGEIYGEFFMSNVQI